jgi:F-type H+-transporting ATPase subunit delta
MAELATLARPYAQAAFNFAHKASTLAAWSSALHTAADISNDAKFAALIGDPRLNRDQLKALLFDIGGDQFSEEVKRFLGSVVENDRLPLLGEVSQQFDELLNEAENRVEVQITSAYAVRKEQQRLLSAALEKRFGKSVELHTTVDKTLIGGAIIRVGDEVIDGSLLGGLKQMATQLHSS